MTNRAALPVVTAAMLALSSPAGAFELDSADAFACGTMSGSSAAGWAAHTPDPEEEKLYRVAGYQPDAASTVKLRIVYEKGNRVEVDHCGGTVISADWIVTAGHCVAADRSWSRIEIVAGDQHLDGPSAIKRTATDAVCHAGFRYETLENDIALIRLDKPLPKRITPMKMDGQSRPSVRSGTYAQGRGWPVTGMRSGDRMLNKVSLQILDVQMRSYITATSADQSSFGLCRGESGGPLVSDAASGRTLAGVLSGIQPGTTNSYGEDCMLSGYEMYFTPIAAFRGWIDRVTSICDANRSSCRAGGGGMMLASQQPYQSAPVGYGSDSYIAYAQPVASAPSYAMAGMPAAMDPNYIHTGSIDMYATQAPIQTYAAPVDTYGYGGGNYIDTGMYISATDAYGAYPAAQGHRFIPGHAREQ